MDTSNNHYICMNLFYELSVYSLMRNITILLIILFCFSINGFGQIRQEGTPDSFVLEKAQIVSSVQITPEYPNRKRSGQKLPAIAGFTVPFEFDTRSSGGWITSSEGSTIWRLEINIEGALASNIYFQNLEMQEGDKLFVYTKDRQYILGAFTEINNTAFFPTEFLPGNQLIVEYNSKQPTRVLPFQIAEIGIADKETTKSVKGFGDSGFCEVKMNCPEGDNWQTEKRGVSRILVKEGSSLFWCSGVLLNNTNLDASPYLLTANHCGENSTEIDYLGWLFYFNYESKDCEMPAFEPNSQSLEGAVALAQSANSNNSGSDFKLLELNKTVPDSYEPYYNGWDWTDEGAKQGVSIHHPEGDIKMVSTYEESLVSANYNNPSYDPDGKYWKVEWVETESGHGVTEGGSSGSPIFSESGLVVGALSGGKASCGSPTLPDYYGKFSYSWASNGSDSSRQLQPWLDPGNSGVQILKGLDSDTSGFRANFSSNTTQVRIGGTVEFYNQSEGSISSYEWKFPGGNPESSELATPPPVTYQSAGEFDVMLVARSDNKIDTLLRTEYIRVLPTLSPNPSSGKFKINFGESLPDELDLQVIDMQGRNVNFFLYSEEENTVTIDLTTQSSGIYFIRVKADENEEVLKASVISQSKED